MSIIAMYLHYTLTDSTLRDNLFADIQQLAEEMQSFKEFETVEKLQSGGLTDSDLSFSGETSHDDSSPDKISSPDTADEGAAIPSELLTRGKRRASMSAVPPTKAAPITRARKATVAVVDSKKATLPVVAAVAHSTAAALLEDSEDEVVANFSKLRKRRASCVPMPAAVPVAAPPATVRQSARRGSLTSKMLASTLAAVQSSIESTAAVSVAVKTTSKIPESGSRLTRRKSMALSATMPAPVLAAVAPVCEVPATEKPVEEPEAAAVTESESDRELHAPKASEEPQADSLPRRRAIRRGSLGGSAGTDTSNAESVRTSNRRRSIAEVTAMLASIDAVKSIGLPVGCPSGPAQDSTKKRGAEEVQESASSKKKKQQQDASVDLSITELAAPAPQVWIDV